MKVFTAKYALARGLDYILSPARDAAAVVARIPLYMHEKVASMVDAVQQHPLVQKVSNFAPTEYYQNLKQTGRQYRMQLDQLRNQYADYMSVAGDVWYNVGKRRDVRWLSDALKNVKETVSKTSLITYGTIFSFYVSVLVLSSMFTLSHKNTKYLN